MVRILEEKLSVIDQMEDTSQQLILDKGGDMATQEALHALIEIKAQEALAATPSIPVFRSNVI